MHVRLIGFVGQVVTRRTQSGTTVLSFGVADRKSWKDKNDEWQDHTSWWNIEMWAERGERVASWLEKGHKVMVEGSAEVQEWTDQGNNPQRTVKITPTLVNRLHHIPKQRDDAAPPIETHPQESAQVTENNFTEDDIPF